MLRQSISLFVASALCAAVHAGPSMAPDAKSLIDGLPDVSLSGGAANALFGQSIANAGDVNGDGYEDLLVGAPGHDGTATDAGAAFLFFGSAEGFEPFADWQVIAGQSGGRYGSAVAGVGDVNGDGFDDFVVGAEFVDNGQTDEGLAYLYLGGATISTTSSAFVQTNQAASYLGGSVAGVGDVNGDGYADFVVGGSGHDGGATNSGVALLFFGGATFDTSPDATLTSSQAGARMGSSVAGVGDVNGDGYADLVVGAYDYDSGQTNEGAAFLYLGGAGSFNITTDAHFQNDQAGSSFGSAVAGAGDVNGDGYSDILVGARAFSDGQTNEGAAYLYFGGVGSTDTVADFTVQGESANAELSLRMAGFGDIDGDGFGDFAVGAPGFTNGSTGEGQFRVFLGGQAGPSAAPYLTAESDLANAGMGGGLALVDHNRDGRSEVFVGLPGATGNQAAEGRVHGYRTAGRLMDVTHDLVIEFNSANAEAGRAVASGDVNGDGYADLLIGQPAWSVAANGAGRVTLHLGSASGLNALPSSVIETGVSLGRFGSSVATGDVNDDGFADVIVGSPSRSNGEGSEGMVHVYFGGAGAFDTTADVVMESNQGAAEFGHSVAFGGDINGDGYGDVLVGSRFYDNGQNDEGAMFLFLGGASMNAVHDGLFDLNQASAYLGYSVAGIGDINGDGYADMAAGAIGFDQSGATNAGTARIWFGAASIDTVVDRSIDGSPQTDGRLGSAIAGVGDVNNDGFDDYTVGAAEQNLTQTDQGVAYLFRGGTNPGVVPDASLTTTSTFGLAQAGAALAPAGDVNGDGYADLWVGVPRWANGGTSATGLIQLYLGGSASLDTTADRELTHSVGFSNLGASIASADFDGDGDMDVASGAPFFANGQSNEGGVFVFVNQTADRPASAQTYRAMPFGPVEAWGRSGDGDGFIVGMEGHSPRGRERGGLQLESCPPGVPFGAPACALHSSSAWTDLGATFGGTSLAVEADGLAFDELYRWRARVVYAPYTVTQPGIVTPLGRAGPWRRLQGRTGNGDVRVSDALFKDGFE